MIIQYILIITIMLMFVYFLKSLDSHRTKAWIRILFTLFIILAVLAVIFPEELTFVANKLGVGRGTDLLVYSLSSAFIFVVLLIYIKFKDQNERIAELARKIALNQEGRDQE